MSKGFFGILRAAAGLARQANEGIQQVNDFVHLQSEVQRATSDLRRAIHLEQTIINATLESAKRSHKLEKYLADGPPGRRDSYLKTRAELEKSLPKDWAVVALPIYKQPDFDIYLGNVDQAIQAAIQTKIETLQDERRTYLADAQRDINKNALWDHFRTDLNKFTSPAGASVILTLLLFPSKNSKVEPPSIARNPGSTIEGKPKKSLDHTALARAPSGTAGPSRTLDEQVEAATRDLRSSLTIEKMFFYLAFTRAKKHLRKHLFVGPDVPLCLTFQALCVELRGSGALASLSGQAQFSYTEPNFNLVGRFAENETNEAVLIEVEALRIFRASFIKTLNKGAGSELYARFLIELQAIGGPANPNSVESVPAPVRTAWIQIGDEGSGQASPNVESRRPQELRSTEVKPVDVNLHISRQIIKATAEGLGVPYLTHFTKTKNLPSILHHGLCSIKALREKGISHHVNDRLRLDGHLGATCVSIAHPNDKMFAKYRWENHEHEWVVLVLDPAVLWTMTAAFCPHNAADNRVRKRPIAEFLRPSSFDSMFLPSIDLRTREMDHLKPFDPTDVQAEILIFDTIPPELIRSAVFSHAGGMEMHKQCLGRRAGTVHAEGRGFFGARTYARKTGWTY